MSLHYAETFSSQGNNSIFAGPKDRYMKKLNVCRAALALFCLVALASSCVDNEYDMSGDRVNLEVTPFQKGLAIPLGNTGQVKLGDLLKEVNTDILNNTGGLYSIGYSGTQKFDDELESIAGLVKIEDIDFSKPISFQLNNADLSDVKIPAQDHTFPHKMTTDVKIPDMTIPTKTETVNVLPELEQYIPAESEMKIPDLTNINRSQTVVSIKSGFDASILPFGADELFSVADLFAGQLADQIEIKNNISFDSHYNLEIILPKDIESVNAISLNPSSAIRIRMAIEETGFIHSGAVVPDITLDFSQLCELRDFPDGKVNLKDALVLNEGNNYTGECIYSLTSLDLDHTSYECDYDGKGSTRITEDLYMAADGTVDFSDLKTTKNLLSDPANSTVAVRIYVEFVDVHIADVDMVIAPKVFKEEAFVDFSIKNITLPADIEKVNYVSFTEDSGLNINLKSENLEKVPELAAEVEHLEIVFPEELVIEDDEIVDNRLILTNQVLSEEWTRDIKITRVNFGAPVDGKVSFEGEIAVRAKVRTYGHLHSSEIPRKAEDMVKIDVNVISAFEMDDYGVVLKPTDYNLAIEPEEIKTEVPKELADLKDLVVYPKNDPVISLDINLPEMALDFTPSDEGVRILLPDFLGFRNLPADYHYDLATNSISFVKGQIIPGTIELPIEKLIINPAEGTDGKYYIQGLVEIEGGVTLAGGEVTKKDIEKMSDPANEISVVAHIPEIVPADIELGKYETTLKQTIDLELLDADALPEQVKALSYVELNDAKINISLDASELPAVGDAKLSVNVKVQLPDFITAQGVSEDGIYETTATMTSEKIINFSPIVVKSLDLSKFDLSQGVKEKVSVEGSVVLEDVSLNIDEWLNRDLDVVFNASMQNIDIAKVAGKVDYQLDIKPMKVDVKKYTDKFGDWGIEDNPVLDLARLHLALDVKTNLSVPAAATVELVPYDGEVERTEGIVTATLSLDPAPSVSETKLSRFWVSENDEDMPAGYTFVEVPGILDMVKPIPSKIVIRVDGGTKADEECVLEPGAKYTFDVDYAFGLPLEFGEDFYVKYRTKIKGLPEIVGQVLSFGSKIMIGGKFFNSLPLGVNLTMHLLDAEGNRIPFIDEAGVQKIAPCLIDGSASSTDLEVVILLENPEDAARIADLELVLEASDGVVGVQAGEDDYLEAALQLILPEGVTIDLKELPGLLGGSVEEPEDVENTNR